jgi:multidrug efflux system outer membrane protein
MRRFSQADQKGGKDFGFLASKLSVKILLLVLLWPAVSGANKYTLEQLLARVKSDYPGVTAARVNMEVADAQLSQARRLWWPQGQLTFGFTLVPPVHCTTGNLTPQGLSPGASALDNCINTNTNPADVSNISASQLTNPAFKLDINLIQPIYTSGKIESAIKAAHAGQDAAAAQAQAAEADAVYNAIRAYWGLKAARAARATLSDGRDKVKEWVGSIDKALNDGNGKYTEQDLLRLKIAVDTLELGLLEIDRGEKIAQAALRTMTADPTADVDDAELEVSEVAERPLGYYEDAARFHRPEAKLLEAAGAALHAQRNLRLSEMLPDIGLVGSFNYYYAQNVDDPHNAFLNHPNSLGVGLSVALRQPLDIPLRLAGFSKARAEERAFEWKRKEALGGIALEIEKAFADASAARKRQTLTAHGEKIARGWYNSVDQLLQVGTVESKDLVDAARSYFELRLQHFAAIMDLNVALAGLKRSAGVE